MLVLKGMGIIFLQVITADHVSAQGTSTLMTQVHVIL
jgi:hypothetical protein